MMKRHVLVVDDERPIRFSVERLLRRAGYSTSVACNGAEALELLSADAAAARSIDLVLLDMQMPGMNGMEVILALKDREPAVRVLPMAGSITKETAALLAEHGCAKLIEKPFERGEILARLAALLGGESPA